MAVRGDEYADRIEAHLRESLEKIVQDIRASVEDVRVAVDQQLTAAVQSVQADVNTVSFAPRVRELVLEFENAMGAPVPPPAPPVPVPDARKVRHAVQAVERCRTQVDVLNAMLDQCLDFSSRSALFILKGDVLAGWKGVGFARHGGNDDSIKRLSIAPNTVPEFDRLLRDEKVVSWDPAAFSSRLGVPAGVRALLVPMVIKDKVAAVLYADSVSEELAQFDTAALELIVFSTGLLIDTLAFRKKTPSPSLSEPADAAAETQMFQRPAAAPVPPPAPPQRPPVSRTPTPPPMPRPAPDAPSADETIAISSRFVPDLGAVPPPPAPPPASKYVTTVQPAFTGAPAAVPAEPVEPGERTTTQYIPPAGIQRGGAFGGPALGEEGRKHDEAKRFARLLVSEIKLYNEAKVEQGRKNRDLYERLKEDIDRSRQMYEERISEDVRKMSNYFYEELVRILADGNADALGL